MSDKSKTSFSRRDRLILYLLGLIFAVPFFWSVWFETLQPLVKEGDSVSLLYHLIGIPIILAGTAVIVYGGYKIVRNTFSFMADSEMLASIQTVRNNPSKEAVRRARWLQLRYYRRAWTPGALWMAAGFALIAVGGYLINR